MTEHPLTSSNPIKFDNEEQQFTRQVMEYMTDGQIAIFVSISRLIVRIMALLSMVFLRRKVGTYFVSFSTIFWGSTFLGLVAMFSVTSQYGNAEGYDFNTFGVLYFYYLAFVLMSLYHIFSSRRNLRLMREKRSSLEPGYSVLYKYFYRLVEPLGLICKEARAPYWWEWDPYKFQKWLEPALVIGVGLLFKTSLPLFGGLIVFSGLCNLLLTMQNEDAYYRAIQQKWDAEVLGEVMMVVKDQPADAEANLLPQRAVILRAHMRPKKEFQKAQQQNRREESQRYAVTPNGSES